MSDERQIFSLKQVVSSIRKTIEERYQSLYWVKAEMHKLNLYPSGHAFPELVQKEEGKIVAQINGSIWKHNFQRINQRFIDVVKEPLKEGTTLLFQVKVTYHETFGMSLQIMDIDPSFTLGELQRERQETLSRLKKEGLLNANQQLDFPLLPQRIAIISADTSKGLSDFMKVLDHNQWGYAYFTHLFPAYLQGDIAIQSIVDQLKRIEKVRHHFDVVVIVRGGGGEVGMSCYNNYDLCRAIASFPLPILTGIGHSTNLTVAEMIAYRNAITPTELGEFLLQAFHEFNIPVQEAQKSILRLATNMLENAQKDYVNVTRHFTKEVKNSMQQHRNILQNTSQTLNAQSVLKIEKQRERIRYITSSLAQDTKRFVHQQSEVIEHIKINLSQNSMRYIGETEKNIGLIENTVRLLDPSNVLKRGYAIARYKGSTIKLNHLPVKDDSIEIETLTHTFIAKVEEATKKHEQGN